MIIDDLGKLIENVRQLVGEVDFTFHPRVTLNEESNESMVSGGRESGID